MSCTGKCNQGRSCTCCTSNSCDYLDQWGWVDEIKSASRWLALGIVGTVTVLLMAGFFTY